MNKKEGSIPYVVAIVLLIFATGCFIANMRIQNAKVSHNHVNGALVAANLAAELVDLDRYANDRTIMIKDPDKSYEIFEKTLKSNIGLGKIIDNQVNIENFIIYDVEGNNVKVIKIKPNYSENIIYNGLNNTKTPSGVKINSTSIYTKVSYKVRSFIGEKTIYNECTTDVKGKR